MVKSSRGIVLDVVVSKLFSLELLLLGHVTLHDLSQDQIQREKGTDGYQSYEEKVARYRVVATISVVVHQLRPAFESANLKCREKCI